MMKKVIYGTIILFVTILVIVIIIATMTPIETVDYQDGKIVETGND